jgi:hypothetical protein
MSETKSSLPDRCFFTAWFVGSFTYMLLAGEVIADAGVIAVPFQAVMGAIFSLVLVGVAYLLGQLLRIQFLAKLWYSSPLVSIALIAVALVVLFFGRSLGLTAPTRFQQGDLTLQTLHPLAAYGSMFVVIFATLHFSRDD